MVKDAIGALRDILVTNWSKPPEPSIEDIADLDKGDAKRVRMLDNDVIRIFETAHNEAQPELIYDYVNEHVNITIDCRTVDSRQRLSEMRDEVRRIIHAFRKGDNNNFDRLIYKTRTDLSDRSKKLFRYTLQCEIITFSLLATAVEPVVNPADGSVSGGNTYQTYDGDLQTLAAMTPSDSVFIVGNGLNWVAESGATARTSLGLGTIATQDSDDVSITGGSINGVAIGTSTTGVVYSITANTGITANQAAGAVTLNVGGLTVSELAANSLQLSSESFADNDTSLMTSAAILDKITAELAAYTSGVDLTGGTGVLIQSETNTGSGDYSATITLDLKDEDNMASNSAIHAASQQSIKAYVDTEVAALVDSAPGALDTLNELAAAINDDATFVTTMNNALGNRVKVDGSQSFTSTQQAQARSNIGLNAGSVPSAGTGIDISGSGEFSVDVSDFMSSGVDNYLLTATGADTFQGESTLTYDGTTLTIDNGADEVIALGSGSGLATIEIGGDSGARIDLKSPNSDDFDIRLHTTGSGGELVTASPLTFKTSNNNDDITFAPHGSGKVKFGASGFTLPTSDGTANQTLKTDGSGALTFQNDLNHIYAISSATVSGGANIVLTASGSGSGTDVVKIAGGTNSTVTQESDVITIASLNTLYEVSTATSGSDARINLTAGGSGSGTDFVTLAAGSNVQIAETGDTITISSTSATTYDFLVAQTSGNNDNPALRLDPSTGSNDDIAIVGGTNVTVTRDSNTQLTITSTDTNTQNVFATSFVDSTNDAILRLTKSGASSGTQDVKFVAGANITLTPDTSTSPQQLTIAGVPSANDATITLTAGTGLSGGGNFTTDQVGNETLTFNVDTNTIATKSYVDGVKQGLDTKDSVRVATTANITRSGTQTIDGIAVQAGDRVLVKDQSDGSENGIFVASASGWSRASDADADTEVTAGLYVWVEEGNANADQGYILTNTGTITLDSTSLTFTQFSGAGQISAGTGLSKSGNTLNVGGLAVAQFAGATVQTSSEVSSFGNNDTSFLTAGGIKNYIEANSFGFLTSLNGITISNLAANSIQLSSESFADNDTSLMTSAAIDDRIISFGYTTNTGDITGVVAGTGLTGGANSGSATVNLDISGLTAETSIANDDLIAIYDTTASAMRKMTRANFITGLGTGISFNGSTANGLLSYGGSSTADVESTLTYNGTDLMLKSATPRIYIGDTDNTSGGSVGNMLLISKSGSQSYIRDRQSGSKLNLGASDDTDIMVIDGDTARVGIGTSSPAAKLDLRIGSGFALMAGADVNAITLNDNTRKFARFGLPHYDTDEEPVTILTADSDSAYSRISIGGGTNAGNAPSQIFFHTGANTTTQSSNTATAAITSTGLGIGTTSPGHKLHVSGPADDSGDYAIYADEGNDNYAALVNRHSANRRTALFYRNIHADYTAQPMVEMHNDHADDDQSVLKITQDGSGNAISASVNDSDAIEWITELRNRPNPQASGLGNFGAGIKLALSSGSGNELKKWVGLAAVKSPDLNYSRKVDAAFYTQTDASGGNDPTEKMRITGGGNVGIGTTAPAALLDIHSTSGNQLRLSYNGTFYWILERDSSGKLNITNHQNDTDVKAITIDTTEQVGIGTSSPGGKLHLLDSSTLTTIFAGTATSDGVVADISFRNAADSIGAIQMHRVSNNSQADMSFHTQPNGGSVTERMRIDSTGKVGIGSNAPASLLHVGSNAYELSSGAYLTGSHQRTAKMVIHADDANTDWDEQEIGLALHNEDPTNNNWSPHIAFTTHEDDDGNPANANPVAVAAISATYNTRVANGWAKGDLVFFTNNAGSGNAERLRITSDGTLEHMKNTDAIAYHGRAAIGHSGHSDYAAFGHLDTFNTGGYALLQYADGRTFLNAEAGQSIRFRIHNNDKMILTNDGKVGIGETAPLFPLHLKYTDNRTDPEGSGSSSGAGAIGANAQGGGLYIENESTTDGSFAGITFRTDTADARIAYQSVGSSLVNEGQMSFFLDTNDTGSSVFTLEEVLRLRGGGSGGGQTFNSVDLPVDNARLRVGAGQDLELFHNASHSFIKSNTGELKVLGSTRILNNANNKTLLLTTDHATTSHVELYYNDAKKFETTSAGATVTGALTVTGDLLISGTTTTINTTNLAIEDNIVVLNSNVTGTPADVDAGIEVERGDETNVYFRWDEGLDSWVAYGVGDYTLRSETAHGYIRFGPANTSYAHIDTDREKFYFNKEVLVDTGNFGSHNDDLNMRRARSNDERILIQDNSMTFTSAGNNVMKIDGSNTRVGIGDTSPAEALQVAGNIRINNNGIIRADGTGYLQLGNTNGGDIRIFGDGSSSRIQAHGNSLYLQTNRDTDDIIFAVNAGGTDSDSTVVEAMRIVGDTGNVGIGTTTPVGKFSVQLADATSNGNVGAWDDTYALFGDASSTGGEAVGIGFGTYGGVLVSLDPGSAWENMNYMAGAHFFKEANTVVMSIDGGNVGMGGVTSPQHKLDIDGNLFLGKSGESTALSGSPQIFVQGDTAVATFKSDNASSGDQVAGIRVFGDGYRSVGMVIGDYDNSDGSMTEDWIFGRQYASNHKAGIMATPENGGDEYVTVQSHSQKQVIIANDSDDIDFLVKGTGGTYLFGEASTARVGIGTTSPGTTLHLSDAAEVTLSVDSSHATGAQISLDSTGTGGDEWRIVSGADNAGIGGGAFGLYNVDASAYRLTVLSTGKVGIGTTTPQEKLHVKDGDIYLNAGDFHINQGAYKIKNASNGNQAISFPTSGNLAIEGVSVGIGTTSPAVKLHITDATDPKIRVQDTTANYSATLAGYSGGAYLGMGDMDSSESNWLLFGAFSNINNLQTRDRDFHLYGTNTTTGFYFDESAGKFGIGTTSPAEKLEVSGNIKATNIKATGAILNRNNRLISASSQLLDVQWALGSGSETNGYYNFTQNGETAENERVWGDAPSPYYPQRGVLWRMTNATGGSAADGGWETASISINHTKTYRFSVFARQESPQSGSGSMTMYFGSRGYGDTNGLVHVDNDNVNTNPYFWAGDLPETGKWYLLVGHILGSGDTSPDTNTYGGIYDVDTGRRVDTLDDSFRWHTDTTTTRHRCYLFYYDDSDGNTDPDGYFFGPRVDLCDGTEPPISSLINGGYFYSTKASTLVTIANDNASANAEATLRLMSQHGSDTWVDLTENTYGNFEITGGASTRRSIMKMTDHDTDTGTLSFNADHKDWDTKIYGDSATAAIMVDGSTDRVGIFNESPSTALDVAGDISGERLNLEKSSGYASIEIGGGSGAFIDMKNPFSDDFDCRLITDGTGLDIIAAGSGNHITLKTNGTERFQVEDALVTVTPKASFTTSVNIGSVTNSPAELNIVRSGENAALINFAENDQADIEFGIFGNFAGAGETGNAIYVGTGISSWAGNAEPIMLFRGDGNVAIGGEEADIDIASGKGLQIFDGTQANLRLTDTSDSASSDIAQSANDLYIINRKTAGDIKFRVNSSNEVLALDGGTVSGKFYRNSSATTAPLLSLVEDSVYADNATLQVTTDRTDGAIPSISVTGGAITASGPNGWGVWQKETFYARNYGTQTGQGSGLHNITDGDEGNINSFTLPYDAKLRAVQISYNTSTDQSSSTADQSWRLFHSGDAANAITTITKDISNDFTNPNGNFYVCTVNGLDIDMAKDKSYSMRRESGSLDIFIVRIDVYFTRHPTNI